MSEKGHSFSNPNLDLSNKEGLSGMGSLLDALSKFDQKKAQEQEEKEELKKIAYTDKLTGLKNRHALEETIESFNIKKGSKSGIFFLDLNDLGETNNQFGYPAGDKKLKKMANIAKKVFRTGENKSKENNPDLRKYNSNHDEIFIINEEDESLEPLIARWGGDEIVILLSDLNLEDFSSDDIETTLTNRTKSYISEANKGIEDKDQQLSVSIGFSLVDPENDYSLQDTINRASGEMKLDKEKHRIKKLERIQNNSIPSAPVDDIETTESN